ncbi:hypothetical protein QTN25_007519 [Entamoeba marina]
MSETPHISKVNLVDYYCKSTPGIKQNIVELDKLMNSFREKRGQYEVTKINSRIAIDKKIEEILNKRNSIIHGNTITSVIKEEEEIQENIIIKEEQENDIFSNNRKENISKKEEKTIIVNKVGIPYFWLKVLWEKLIEIDDGYIEVISKSIDWKIDLIEINKNSFFNVFDPDTVNYEDYCNIQTNLYNLEFFSNHSLYMNQIY